MGAVHVNKGEKDMDKIFKTILLVFIFCIIWTTLEKFIYGEVQPRIVDDIIMILLIPVFYSAVS